jgi:acetate kinase
MHLYYWRPGRTLFGRPDMDFYELRRFCATHLLERSATGLRVVLAPADEGDELCALALDVSLHRLCAGIAAMTAALGGLDALVFTGGVGEHAPAVRSRAIEGLEFLGLVIDERPNHRKTGDRDISTTGAQAKTLVVPAREDLEIAHHARAVLQHG